MEYYLSINKKEVILAVQKAVKRMYPELDLNLPPVFMNLLVKDWTRTPGIAVHETNVIYLKGNIPPEYVPLILTHEMLHLLVYDFFKESKGVVKASSLSGKTIDNVLFGRILAEALNISFKELDNWLIDYIVENSMGSKLSKTLKEVLEFAKLKAKKRRLEDAFQENKGTS